MKLKKCDRCGELRPITDTRRWFTLTIPSIHEPTTYDLCSNICLYDVALERLHSDDDSGEADA